MSQNDREELSCIPNVIRVSPQQLRVSFNSLQNSFERASRELEMCKKEEETSIDPMQKSVAQIFAQTGGEFVYDAIESVSFNFQKKKNWKEGFC